MSSDKIIELGAHAPSVESVLGRLVRNMDSIKNILLFVEYKDTGGCQVAFSTMSSADLCYASQSITYNVNQVVFAEADEQNPGST